MCRPILWLILLPCLSVPVFAQEFSHVKRDYVPEGKPKKQSSISTVEQYQAVCAVNDSCKAYAFRTSKPVCYLYSHVYVGGTPRTRELGMFSSGLSIVRKSGFVSTFKKTAFPVFTPSSD
jgi:hypothetical protein